ncbi:iron dicitrate transport regulator FecR [Alicyclobacillus cycloheptanicus]|nr:iron dicitrate transport regulator FecR [Alicyclobacillus cycloheptanicus]
MSKASGLPLVNETVAGIRLRDLFRPQLLNTDPKRFYEAYRVILNEWRSSAPNPAHIALAKRGAWVITQNIDGLHRDAGSEHVIELHGNLRELRCPSCDQIYGSQLAWEAAVPRCPACKDVLRPGITLEGEEVRHFSRALDWVGRAEVLLIVGTKLEMEPVRRLPAVAKRNGARFIEVNRDAERILPKILSFETTR